MRVNDIEEPVKGQPKNIEQPTTAGARPMTIEIVFMHRQVNEKQMCFEDKNGKKITVPLSEMNNFEGLNVTPSTSKEVEVAIVTDLGDGKTVCITGKNGRQLFEKLKKPISVGSPPNPPVLVMRSTNLNCVPATFCGMSVMVDRTTGRLCYFVM